MRGQLQCSEEWLQIKESHKTIKQLIWSHSQIVSGLGMGLVAMATTDLCPHPWR